MTPREATTDSTAAARSASWRYEVQHGPDGEANYAWVYDEASNLVCIAKTHHAKAIVDSFSTLDSADARERIDQAARIIDPHSFMDIPFTDDPALLDMVEQSKADALRKAEKILGLVTVPDEAEIRADEREKCAKASMIAVQQYKTAQRQAHSNGEESAGYAESGSYFSTDLNMSGFVAAAIRGRKA